MRGGESPVPPGSSGDAGGHFEAVYEELRRLADRYLSDERSSHTLQPTALVNEAYLRLAGARTLEFRDRSHFLSLAARAMRRILVDSGRRRQAGKRGGDWERVTLTEGIADPRAFDADLPDLLHALEKLEAHDPQEAGIVIMRFLGGMTEAEIAAHLGMGERTVRLHWSHARAWLRRELSAPP